MSQIEKVALRGARLTTLAHGFAVVSQIGYFLWASRVLGPEAIGRYQLVIITVTFVALLADLGLGDTLVQDRRPLRGLLPGMVRTSLLASVALTAIGYALILLVPALHAQAFLGATLLVLWITLLDGPSLLLEKSLHREMAFGRVARTELLAQLVHTALGALLVGVWQDVRGMLVAFLVYRTLRTVLFAVSLRGLGIAAWSGGELRWVDRPALRFGLTVVFERGLSHLNSRLDRIVLGALTNEATVGVYTLGRQLFVEPILRLNPILVTVAQPLLARVQDEPERFRRHLVQIYQAVATLLLPAVAGMWAVHTGVVALVLDEQWITVSAVALPLALSALPRTFVVSSTVSALARGWAVHNARIAVITSIALLVLPVAGHALDGFAGFAWGITAATLVQLATVGFSIVWRGHRIGPARVFFALRGPVLAALTMLVVVLAVRGSDPRWTLLHLLACIASGALAYPLALALFDRDWLRWIWRTGLGRARR